jgi:hypothetical protein
MSPVFYGTAEMTVAGESLSRGRDRAVDQEMIYAAAQQRSAATGS